VALLTLLAVSVLFASTIERTVMAFLLKDDATDSVEESLSASRSGLIERSLDNFRAAPITGIGFGVPSEAKYFRPETGFLGLPVSASVEKGFMPSAVLEETGVTGAILVVILLLAIFLPVVRWGTITHFWMMSCCVLINLGEMVFFSVGFMGLFFWLLLAYGYTCSLPEAVEYEDVSGERGWRYQ
ncbi:MAG TPA: hypothetical protein VFG50_08400, partial [Rhodothermales bacterium]|nr:hypothetical protein [Rhodothermales bacterium]